jgi:hypothetical protein
MNETRGPRAIFKPLALATLATLLLLAALVHVARAQGGAERTRGRVIPLTDPKKPVTLEVELLSGGITVLGYDGEEVRVSASEGEEGEDENEEDLDPRARGLRRVRSRGGLAIEESRNVVRIEANSWRHSVNIEVRVPRRTSLDLSTINSGDILVRGIEGEISLQNTNGGITVEDAAGSVLAEAVNGDIVVRLNRITPDKSMSFVSMNGDLDVTLPADARANLRLSTENGEIFTDFDVQLSSSGWDDDAAAMARDQARVQRELARAERERAEAEAEAQAPKADRSTTPRPPRPARAPKAPSNH